MSKENLILRLGADYCSQRMNGTLFTYKDEVYEFVQVDGNKVYCIKYAGTSEKPVLTTEHLPFSAFQDWNALKWPVLGYRQALNGQILFRVGRKNSVQRGLHKNQLYAHMHPVSLACSYTFGLDIHNFRMDAALYLLALKPSYTKFQEGIEQVLSGAIPAFAVSADFAVAPNEQVDFLEILFRGRRIGTVAENGNVSIEAEGILPSWNKATS